MTIPEAASLVLQAATFGGDGTIFVLDICHMVLVSGATVTRTLCKICLFNIQFPYAVENYVYMNVAALVMTVSMSADKSLMSGEVFLREFHSEPLSHLSGQSCADAVFWIKENTKNAVPFSKDESKQNYAIVVKMPALLTAARKLADVDKDSGSISFKGMLYPEDKIIIYNLAEGQPTKKRSRKKKTEDEGTPIEDDMGAPAPAEQND